MLGFRVLTLSWNDPGPLRLLNRGALCVCGGKEWRESCDWSLQAKKPDWNARLLRSQDRPGRFWQRVQERFQFADLYRL